MIMLPFFNNTCQSLCRNPPNCAILNSWILGKFGLADKPFAKPSESLETCVLVNNSLCGKFFKVTWVPLFIPDFKLLSYGLDNFTFKVPYWVISY